MSVKTPRDLVNTVISEVANDHKIGVKDIIGRRRLPHIVRARQDAIKRVASLDPARYSSTVLGRIFQRDHTTILHYLERTAKSKRRAEATAGN